jgi:hypothetical protein
MECILVLQTKSEGDLKIFLTEKVEDNLLINNRVQGVVYSDMEYSARIIFDEQIRNINIYINESNRECYYDNGKIIFNTKEYLNGKIFMNYFGYVSFTVDITTDNGNYEFYSGYLDIAVRNNISSDLLRKMVAYIASNSQKYLFKNSSNIIDFLDIEKSKTKNLYTEISMLENIIFEYENNFKYFRTNVKYKVYNDYIIDDFERLQKVNKDTIQHIISNPQNLIITKYNTNIRYNKFNLIPKKVLLNKNKINYDIYENKVILGFLKYIYDIILNKIAYIQTKFNDSQTYSIRPEYISSYNEIQKQLNKTLNKYLIKLQIIKEKIQKIYFMYKQVLKCTNININGTPKPSPIFIKVQHYRRLYKVIKEWFENGNYNLENEKMILTLLEANQIYEYYILFKINNYIIRNGYKLESVDKFIYKLKQKTKYKNTKYENTFVFKNKEIKIIVYYQPVIYLEPVVYSNNIGLFRNNNISLDGGRAQYYTPDYVIKVSNDKLSKFIILDSKWSTINSVINYAVKDIIYKYAFSISTIKDIDKIDKIWIINGKDTENQKEYIYDFYNSKFKDRNRQLNPSVKILTLNPNVDDFTQESFLNKIFSFN